jgi:trehalose 6-phosphate synthase/phosphatase
LSSKRVIILDFNGTIVIKEDVGTILKRDVFGSTGDAPPHAVCQSLAKLCADPQNTVFVVSK